MPAPPIAASPRQLGEEVREKDAKATGNSGGSAPPCLPWVESRSPAVREAVRLARLYAPAHVPLVLVGESGTGKSDLARRIHEWSGRPGGLTEITVGEFDQHLARDQLFGHARGSFTGAVQRRAGLIIEAGEGTVLLDDCHNMDLVTGAMLLRVLDARRYRPIGFDRDLPVRCRFIFVMREDPDRLVAAGRLLPDFRYRMGRAEVRLPPLDGRREDIAPFASHFLARCPRETGVSGPTSFAPDVLPVLEDAAWPGNLRDLQSVVQVAYLHARDAPAIRYEHLPSNVRDSPRFEARGDPIRNRRVIEWALRHTHGRVGDAAALIGAHRNTVSAVLGGLDPGLFPYRRRCSAQGKSLCCARRDANSRGGGGESATSDCVIST